MSAITTKIDFIDLAFINGLIENFDTTGSKFKELITGSQKHFEIWQQLLLKQSSSQNSASIKGNVHSGKVRLTDKGKLRLFLDQFIKKLSTECIKATMSDQSPFPYEFTLKWPKTESISTSTFLANYDKNSLKFFEKAERAEDTDITLESREGDYVAFHSLFLMQYTDFFDKSLKNSVDGESSYNFPMLTFSTESLENLRGFIYLRALNERTLSNIDALIQLFDLAQSTGTKKLQKEVTHRISDFNGPLNAPNIWRILDRAEKYNVETFYEICVVAAEKLEKLEAEEKCDWSAFPLLWTDLFILAQDKQALITQGRLQAHINQLIEQGHKKLVLQMNGPAPEPSN